MTLVQIIRGDGTHGNPRRSITRPPVRSIMVAMMDTYFIGDGSPYVNESGVVDHNRARFDDGYSYFRESMAEDGFLTSEGEGNNNFRIQRCAVWRYLWMTIVADKMYLVSTEHMQNPGAWYVYVGFIAITEEEALGTMGWKRLNDKRIEQLQHQLRFELLDFNDFLHTVNLSIATL